MPKGYWVAHTQINDLIAYKEYQNANAKPLKKVGGKFLVRGGNQELREGQAKGRTVIIEFENLSLEDNIHLKYHITKHVKYTNSSLGKRILSNLRKESIHFIKVMPTEYKKALEKILQEQKTINKL